ncbi:hypothetical protein COO91_06104 [Nostoc flagelliforme CCNUN1]|uniref:Uncharacterized protein n=1 Tax=Nostoc flagelliforme CCNUN1 TaxID=2038116 RepID=A0A2K8SXD8_9NOSO|nr:hypothetical protein COO91_06104 [Nostoc flagelliforme CCNUN1]
MESLILVNEAQNCFNKCLNWVNLPLILVNECLNSVSKISQTTLHKCQYWIKSN